jgi:hypothetical protein
MPYHETSPSSVLGSVQSQIMRLEDLKSMAIASEDYDRAARYKVPPSICGATVTRACCAG